MADIKFAYAGPTAFTITLNSLADNAARESTHVNNETNLYLDALVKVVLEVGTIANEEAVYIWAYAGNGDGEFTEPASGADAGITLTNPHNMRMIGTIVVPTADVTFVSSQFSVAQAFGGVLPPEWGIIVENQSGDAFDAAGNSAEWVGVYVTSA